MANSNDPRLQEILDNPTPLPEFVELLERCLLQVRHDPSGYENNPHLYGLLHKIFLRLCHGNIPDHAIRRG